MNNNYQQPVIGGMFGLPESVAPRVTDKSSAWLFLKESNLFLANARSGILILIDLLKPANIWMPSYLCPTMVEAVNRKKTCLRFYEVNYDLCIPSMDWIKNVQRGDLAVLIDYFGFPLDLKVAGSIKERGGWVLEDACQALLSDHTGRYSDFVLFSPRKTIGVPDGGILTSCCDVGFNDVGLESAPSAWWLKMLEAVINRREFDQCGGDRRWYRLFREAEAVTPIGYFAMSDLSRKLLFNGFEYMEIAQRRIENYSILAHNLKDIAMFPILPEGTVPLGFPIRHPVRDQIRINLFQEQIYPPVHWQIHGVVPMEFSESHRLACQIMTLPSDQRYGIENIHRMAVSVIKTLNIEHGNLQ